MGDSQSAVEGWAAVGDMAITVHVSLFLRAARAVRQITRVICRMA